ncbi:hypothetical protein GCM10011492_38240 [Flexivirga endophytica]|uniref:Uncharacterized protein n=1 Tax=Flexivirga endophytica TaxID=1849103 RepID=A0A916TG52_9MICO|nr:hypothetical protein [Flexivirga endophytica]GGB43600.1 hypothetical protein GCM10011492_38240 [Flexivirga endophytica]GHB68272.1 hypothetical protein GCM10008112_41270 [Flexivirga endophytica]
MRAKQKLSVTAAIAALAAGATLSAHPSPAYAASSPTPITASNFWLTADYGTTYSEPVAGLLQQAGHASVSTVMDHANHDRSPATAISTQVHGFIWDSGDNNDTNVAPQGITTSRDAIGTANNGRYDGRQLIAASFYNNDPKGSRINLTDWDSNYPDKYRYVLLVEPTGTKAAPSFKDVQIHVGGIAWYGNYLYVADTGNGMRVFDMSKIIKTYTGGDKSLIGKHDTHFYAHNYAYALPQVGKITSNVATGTTKLTWSTISLDRPKKSIVMTEYKCPTTVTCNYPKGTTRAIRFPFASGGAKFAAKTYANQALNTPFHYLNGVASHNGRWWFNDSHDKKLFYWGGSGAVSTYDWVSSGESISYWEDATGPDELWSLREGLGHRNVFAVNQGSYDG